MNKKYILIFLAFIVLGCIGLFFYLNKPHRNVGTADAILTSAGELYQSMYIRKENKLLNQIVQFSGKIGDMDVGADPVVVIEIPGTEDAAVRVGFDKANLADLSNLKVGDNITIKGICTGVQADTLFEGLVNVDIRIRDAIIVHSSMVH